MNIFKIIFQKNEYDMSDMYGNRVLVFGGAFLALVSCMLTALNIFKADMFMTSLTTLLIAGFIVSLLLAVKDKLHHSKIVMTVMCGIIFSVFALTGENDGFAILWILLVPLIGYMLVGVRLGFILSLYFMIFLLIIFYTPFKTNFTDYYTATFIMRFPLLYFATFGAVTFLTCQRQDLYNRINDSAYHDAMTGLKNRRSFDEDVDSIKGTEREKKLSVVSIDLNGLKVANDTHGHEAGDELIISAGKVIRDAFANDDVYRTGGDEYMVLSFRSGSSMDVYELNTMASKWHGNYCDEMSLSAGFASATANPGMGVDELIKLADERMYKNKANYYEQTGKDRRGAKKTK